MDIQRLRSSLRTLQTIHLDLQARLVARFCHDDEDIGSNEAIMRSLEKYAKKVASVLGIDEDLSDTVELVEKAVVRTQTTEGLRCYAKPPSLRPAALESMDTLRGSLAMGLDIASADNDASIGGSRAEQLKVMKESDAFEAVMNVNHNHHTSARGVMKSENRSGNEAIANTNAMDLGLIQVDDAGQKQAPREMISDMEFVAEVRDYLRKMKEREEEEEKAQDAVRDVTALREEIKMADTPLAPNEAPLKTVSDAEFLAEVVEYLRKMREQEEEDEKTKNAVELVAVDRGEEDVVDVDALFAALDNDVDEHSFTKSDRVDDCFVASRTVKWIQDTNVLMVSERNDLAIKKSPKKQKVNKKKRSKKAGLEEDAGSLNVLIEMRMRR